MEQGVGRTIDPRVEGLKRFRVYFREKKIPKKIREEFLFTSKRETTGVIKIIVKKRKRKIGTLLSSCVFLCMSLIYSVCGYLSVNYL